MIKQFLAVPILAATVWGTSYASDPLSTGQVEGFSAPKTFSVFTGKVLNTPGTTDYEPVQGIIYADNEGKKRFIPTPKIQNLKNSSSVEFILNGNIVSIIPSFEDVLPSPLPQATKSDEGKEGKTSNSPSATSSTASAASAAAPSSSSSALLTDEKDKKTDVSVAPDATPAIAPEKDKKEEAKKKEEEVKVVLSDIYHATIPQNKLYSLISLGMNKEAVLKAMQVHPTSLKGFNKRAFINEFCAQWQGKHNVDYGKLDRDSRILALMVLVDSQNLHRTGSELFFDALTFNDEGNRFLTPTNLSALGYNSWNGNWMNKKKNKRHPSKFASLMAAGPNSGCSGTLS